MTCNDCNTGMLVDLSTPLAPSTTSVKPNMTLATKSSTLPCCADSHTDSSQRQCLKETQNIQCETGVLVVIDSPNEKIFRRRKKASAKDHRTMNEGMAEEILSCGGDKGSSPWLLDDSCPDLIEEMFNFSNSTSLVMTPSIRKIDSFTSRPNHSCTLSFAPLAVAASNNNDVFLNAQESAELFEQANTVAVRIALAAKKLPRENGQGGVADADSNDNTETAFDKTPPHQALVIDPMGSFSTAATSTPIGSGDTLPGGRLGGQGGGLQDVSSCSSVVEGNLNQVAGKLFVKPASVVGTANKAGGGIAMSRMTRRSVQAPLVSNYRKNEGNASIDCGTTTSRNSRPPLAVAARRAPSVGGFGGLVPGLIHNRSACSTSSIGSAGSNSVMSDKGTASAAVPPSARFARAGSLLAPRTKQVRPTLVVSRLKPMQPSVSKATSEDTSAADSQAIATHTRLSGKTGVAPMGRGTPKKTMRVSTSSNDLYGDCATTSRVGHKSVIAPSLSKTTGLVKPEANFREQSKVRTSTTTANKPKLEPAAAEKGRGRLAATSSTANAKLLIKTLPPSGRR